MASSTGKGVAADRVMIIAVGAVILFLAPYVVYLIGMWAMGYTPPATTILSAARHRDAVVLRYARYNGDNVRRVAVVRGGPTEDDRWELTPGFSVTANPSAIRITQTAWTYVPPDVVSDLDGSHKVLQWYVNTAECEAQADAVLFSEGGQDGGLVKLRLPVSEDVRQSLDDMDSAKEPSMLVVEYDGFGYYDVMYTALPLR